MITGSYPPLTCGIGDYTAKLAEALAASGIEVDVYSANVDWNFLKAKQLATKISATTPDVVHIQYPGTGYGHKLGPQALSFLLKPCVVTIHEASQAHLLRKLSLYPFAFGAERMIFTSGFEMNYAIKFAPWLAKQSCVIPIGSFISTPAKSCEKDLVDIVSFGLIRPNKGIEQIIALAALIKSQGLPLNIRVIGSIDPKQPQYLEELQSTSCGLPITWDVGLDEPQVANLLARSRIAYMPFPDGASERRSSLLAVLLNGVATISTQGAFTTNELAESLAFADTPEQALLAIKQLLEKPERLHSLAQRAREYGQKRSWQYIASLHAEFYQQMQMIEANMTATLRNKSR